MNDKTRLTLDLTKTLDKRLEQLKNITGKSSKADVVREALRLYEYVVARTRDGTSLLLEKDGRRERLIIFGVTAGGEITKPGAKT